VRALIEKDGKMKVIFSHGKESGPWGSKIKYLAKTASSLGCSVDSIDYSGVVCPEKRVEMLHEYILKIDQPLILVGSSMGGYVSICAAEKSNAKGIFLLAPALYMETYEKQEYKLGLDNVEIVHGWSDNVIPIENSILYAQKATCSLHLIDGDHRLNSSLEVVNDLFTCFLNRLIDESNKHDAGTHMIREFTN
jgi:pimeloyl-ACP methyl ester carboxylesterase